MTSPSMSCNLSSMEPFVIKKSKVSPSIFNHDAKDMYRRLAMLKASTKSKPRFNKLVSEFRMTYPTFENDTQLNIAKLYVNNNNSQKAFDIIDGFLKKEFASIAGTIFLAKRMLAAGDIGNLANIPTDVLATNVMGQTMAQ